MGTQDTQPGLEPVPAELEVAPSDGLNVFYDASNEKYTIESDAPIPPALPQQEEHKPRRWNRRRKIIWLTIALSIAISLVIIVAVVAGVETSKNKNRHSSNNGPTLSSIPQSTAQAPITTNSAASSTTPSSRTLKRTSAAPKATKTSTIPPLGRSAPRDCPSSNGTVITAASPFDSSAAGTGSTSYKKVCNANMVATNKKDLASFVVNSFDSCIQSCAGQISSMPVSAVYHWKDGTEDPEDAQRPGTCWCCAGTDAQAVDADNCDVAIPQS